MGANSVLTVDLIYPIAIPAFHHDRSDLSKDFFSDTPWLKVAPERLSTMKLVSTSPRGGLLGGSGKPSKLAALAAARRKREEENQALANKNENLAPDRTISLLDQLGNNNGKGNDAEPASTHRERRNLSFRPAPKQETKVEEPSNKVQETEKVEPATIVPDVKGTPSTFAMTMFGPRMAAESFTADTPVNKANSSILIHEFPSDKAFASPSPDDVVLNAQAKGIKRS